MTAVDQGHRTELPASAGESPGRPGLNTETLALSALFVAIFAFLAALFAVGLAGRSIDEHEAIASAPAASSGETLPVSLSEFAIAPDELRTSTDTRLAVTNDGAVVHNLSVEGKATPMLQGGEAAELDISGLAPGTYTLRCDVAGHEAAGMKATLTIE